MKTQYLSNTKEMFAKAYDEGYAIGAFNVNHTEQIQAAAGAAANLKSAVIIQASPFTAKYTDLGYIVAVADYAAKLAGVPVALHLDHGEDMETVKKYVEAGFTSVMIDGSRLPYEENVALTKMVCEYAHPLNVTVEGEIGTLSGIEDGVKSEEGLYTDPDQAKDFAEKTGVDSLAVAIGTSHGAYKFKPGQNPALRFDILQEIQNRLPGLPIVLHGASSVNQDDVKTINEYGGDIKSAIGIPEDMLSKVSQMAVCKINVETDSRLAMTGAVRKVLYDNPSVIDTRVYFGAARDMMQKRVEYKMENVFHSAGRY